MVTYDSNWNNDRECVFVIKKSKSKCKFRLKQHLRYHKISVTDCRDCQTNWQTRICLIRNIWWFDDFEVQRYFGENSFILDNLTLFNAIVRNSSHCCVIDITTHIWSRPMRVLDYLRAGSLICKFSASDRQQEESSKSRWGVWMVGGAKRAKTIQVQLRYFSFWSLYCTSNKSDEHVSPLGPLQQPTDSSSSSTNLSEKFIHTWQHTSFNVIGRNSLHC